LDWLKSWIFVCVGQRPQFVTQQQPQIRHVESRHLEPRLLAPPATPVTIHNAPASFVSPQRMPLPPQPQQPISSLPQLITTQVITVAGPTQTAPQSHVYAGMPPDQPLPPPHQPVVFPGQPNFPNQNYVGQQQLQQGMSVIRTVGGATMQPVGGATMQQVGGATMQPVYRNVEPLAAQQAANQQPQFLLPTPQHPPSQPVVYQTLLTPAAGNRPPFDGNVVRGTAAASLPSPLPGYVDFGRGEANQLRFMTDFHSDPEIIGQPIETVIHSRKGQEWIGDGRASVGFGQNRPKQFPGVR